MLEQAVKCVEHALKLAGVNMDVAIEFDRIKKALEAQKTPDNTSSPKLPEFEKCFEGMCRVYDSNEARTAFDGAQMMYNFIAGKIGR